MKQSAGLLLYRIKNRQPEVLIAHMGGPFHANKDAGHWSIPKGEYQAEEDPKTVARREFSEELGQPAPDGQWLELGTIKQNNNKQVIAWAVEADLEVGQVKSNTFKIEWPPRSGNIAEFPEIDRAEWFTIDLAAAKLIPAQTQFLSRLADKLDLDKPSFTAEQATLF